jgi:hypothetical protein
MLPFDGGLIAAMMGSVMGTVAAREGPTGIGTAAPPSSDVTSGWETAGSWSCRFITIPLRGSHQKVLGIAAASILWCEAVKWIVMQSKRDMSGRGMFVGPRSPVGEPRLNDTDVHHCICTVQGEKLSSGSANRGMRRFLRDRPVSIEAGLMTTMGLLPHTCRILR